MKKSLFVLIVCVFLFASASCSKKEAMEKSGEVTLWHIQNTGDLPKLFISAAERFGKDNPDYKARPEIMLNDAYKTKLKIALGANQEPDIFFSWTGGPMIDYIKAGKLLDLTTFMTKDNYKDRFFDGAINQATYDGKIWAVPIENTVSAMVFYNKDLFAKYGWTVPKTISELEVLAEKILAAGIKPFSLANKTKWTGSMYYMYLVDRIGGSEVFFNAANRVNGGSFEHPVFIEAGKKIVDWVNKGYFNDGFNGLDEDTGQSRMLLYTDKAAMTIMGSWFIQTVQGENPDFLKKVGAFPFPAYDGGKGNPNAVVGTVGDNFYHISANSKNPEAAFKYLQYLIDDESVKGRIAAGKIPPVKGVTLTDEKSQMVLDIINKASSVQLWYDQYLPSELAEVHKDTSQAIFGKTMTPEAACKEWETQAIKILGATK